MSAYKDTDEPCDPKNVVRMYNRLTGALVYSFCQEHQNEYVSPTCSDNVEYFRSLREYVVETADEVGKPPHASIPNSRCVNRVFASEKSLAEYLFNLEVSDE